MSRALTFSNLISMAERVNMSAVMCLKRGRGKHSCLLIAACLVTQCPENRKNGLKESVGGQGDCGEERLEGVTEGGEEWGKLW